MLKSRTDCVSGNACVSFWCCHYYCFCLFVCLLLFDVFFFLLFECLTSHTLSVCLCMCITHLLITWYVCLCVVFYLKSRFDLSGRFWPLWLSEYCVFCCPQQYPCPPSYCHQVLFIVVHSNICEYCVFWLSTAISSSTQLLSSCNCQDPPVVCSQEQARYSTHFILFTCPLSLI